mmetsp:Transcript_40302/g.29709  ORF Transcript_40302/g.29709 Transcript_40302/m.29709 type:complete len:118 (+) Transcript_40302:348-701(+)|eukprot:CAMPEP_0202969508 /NCGR_PEP_ID=MMETSP1396-20130829/15273_1 /ASSEMBLY_ACC=CAM_ASM_000872 /TAXON_ID= /ORGANISM="Pseudokeronopsis sp., Strain Brazil" /LENGTH=117 /DNA_ID=CAMNT_0049697147 /DNA_START=358 /DNA_END=711 /DNA_ORIENTATION=-
MDDADAKIREMDVWAKKVGAQFRLLRKQLKILIEVKNGHIENQRNLIAILGKYEEKSLAFYTDFNQSKMVLADKTNDLFQGLQDMSEALKNPFVHLYYWVKGELSDVVAFQEALASR